MHIYFDIDTLAVTHIVTAHDAGYDPAINTSPREACITTSRNLAIDRIMLTASRDGDGFTTIRTGSADWTVVSIAEKKDMSITGPSRIRLDEIAHFVGVPDSVSIAIDGVPHGTMDDGGHLEFTPQTTGFFTIVFSLDGYMDREFRLEVVGGN